MGSTAAARAKCEELGREAERLGEFLSRESFGERGPDLETSLSDLEDLLTPLLQRMAAGYLRASVAGQGERLAAERPCPTCGEGCVATVPERERQTTTVHGDFRWPEPVARCDRCRRSFFPSAGGVAD